MFIKSTFPDPAFPDTPTADAAGWPRRVYSLAPLAFVVVGVVIASLLLLPAGPTQQTPKIERAKTLPIP